MLTRVSSILMCILCLACSHSALKEPSASEADVVRDPAAIESVYVERKSIKLDDPKVYDKIIDVYRVGTSSSEDEVDVTFFIGPMPSDISDFTTLLMKTSYRGLFVAFPEDSSGTYTASFLAKENGMDAMTFKILTAIAPQGWPAKMKSLIFVAFDQGGAIVNSIGNGNKNLKNSPYLSKVSGLGFLDAQIPNSSSTGLLKIATVAPMGVKIYLGYEADQASTMSDLTDRLERTGAVQNASQIITPDGLTKANVVSICLPQFLTAVTQDPFLHFQCRKN